MLKIVCLGALKVQRGYFLGEIHIAYHGTVEPYMDAVLGNNRGALLNYRKLGFFI